MAEHMIDIAEMARNAVRSAVMEEVKNLGIRAAVKESINEIGQLDKDEIRMMIADAIDSYVRSANIEEQVKGECPFIPALNSTPPATHAFLSARLPGCTISLT